MSNFLCESCNYSTKYKSDLTKHTKTKKHRNKLISLGIESKETDHMNTNEHDMNTNEHGMNTNEHGMNTNEHEMNIKTLKKLSKNSQKTNKKIKCEYCDKQFNSHASKRRHEKHYCLDNPNFIK